MNYLFDSQEDAPALVPVVLEGKAVMEAFRALLAVYLAGDLPALEVK
jgi:hypothetical protein